MNKIPLELQLIKEELIPGREVWVYTRGGSGGEGGRLVYVDEDLIVVEGIYFGRKYKQFFFSSYIESIKVFKEQGEKSDVE